MAHHVVFNNGPDAFIRDDGSVMEVSASEVMNTLHDRVAAGIELGQLYDAGVPKPPTPPAAEPAKSK